MCLGGVVVVTVAVAIFMLSSEEWNVLSVGHGHLWNKQPNHPRLVTPEGESAQMNIDLQPKKSLSRKRQLMKNEETILLITKNDWNPFERADPKLLEKATQEFTKQRRLELGDAPI